MLKNTDRCTFNIPDIPTIFSYLRGHTNQINSVNFSPTGDKIVTSSDDETAKIWDTESGDLLHTLTGHTRPVNSANFSPTGEKIVTASSDDTVKIWNTESSALLTV